MLMRHDFWILEGTTPVAASFLTWMKWLECPGSRQVFYDVTDDGFVSTVFIDINRNLNRNEPPLLFETIIYGGELDGEMKRYATYEEALAGHNLMCEMVVDIDAVVLNAEMIF